MREGEKFFLDCPFALLTLRQLPDTDAARGLAMALQDARERCYNETALGGATDDTRQEASDALDRLVTLVSRDAKTQSMRKLKKKQPAAAEGGAEGELHELRTLVETQHNEMMGVLERIAVAVEGFASR